MNNIPKLFLLLIALFGMIQAIHYRGLYENAKLDAEVASENHLTCNRELMDYIETSKISLTNSKCITDDQRRLIRAYAERGYSVTD